MPSDLARAARDLLRLHARCPDLFDHVLPISEEDLATLRELADPFADEEDHE